MVNHRSSQYVETRADANVVTHCGNFGSLNSSALEKLKGTLFSLAAEPKPLLIDMTLVNSIGASFVGVLVAVAASNLRRRIVVFGLSDHCRKILDHTEVSKIIECTKATPPEVQSNGRRPNPNKDFASRFKFLWSYIDRRPNEGERA